MFLVTVWNVQPTNFARAVDMKHIEVAINDLMVIIAEFNLSRLPRRIVQKGHLNSPESLLLGHSNSIHQMSPQLFLMDLSLPNLPVQISTECRCP